MAVQIKINTVDKSSLIDWQSVRKVEILTNQPDTLAFLIRNVPTKTYRPALNDDVKMYRDGNLIFGGVVISTKEKINGLVRYFEVTCKDYTELLEGTLVVGSYANQTVSYIINDLLTNFSPGGITMANVQGTYTASAITFNYISLSQALTQLANALAGYDWYIDYNKDIHFFSAASNPAPFNLNDTADVANTNGNYNFGTLEFDADVSQLKNSIVVRGGTLALPPVTNIQTSSGVEIIYYVGYQLVSFTAFHALAASPTTFLSLTVGKDGVDDPAGFNCLYNPDLGLLRFPSAYPANDVVKTIGTPNFPLLSIVSDPISLATYGAKQFLIYDKNITTKQQAIDRANAELLKYAYPLYSGSFETYKDGLSQGMVITINSSVRSISGVFKIQQIETVLRTPSAITSDFKYTVRFVSTQDIGLIDILNKLLIADVANQLPSAINTVPDRVYGVGEIITISESVTASLLHNPQNETITIGESFTNNGLNFGTIFVAGPFTPSSTSRVFVLNGSTLG